MLDKLRATARTALITAKASIWTLLLIAFPYADEILALADKYMPTLAAMLPPNVYKGMGVVIVAAKFALQVINLVGKMKAASAARSAP